MLYSAPGFISADAVKQTLHATQLKGSLILPVLCNQSGRFVGLTGDASYATAAKVGGAAGGITTHGSLDGRQPDCNALALQLDGTIDTKAQLSGGKQWEIRDFYQDVLGTYFPTLANALGLASYGTIGFQALLTANTLANASLVPYSPYFTAKVGLEANLDLKGKLDEWVPHAWWLTMDLSKTGGRLFYNSDVRSSEFQKLYTYASYGYHTDIWLGWLWGTKIYAAGLDGACAYDPSQQKPTQVRGRSRNRRSGHARCRPLWRLVAVCGRRQLVVGGRHAASNHERHLPLDAAEPRGLSPYGRRAAPLGPRRHGAAMSPIRRRSSAAAGTATAGPPHRP